MKKILFFSLLVLMFGNISAQQVKMVRSTYMVGEPIAVKFSGSTAVNDWLAIYTPATVPSNNNSLDWVYTTGTKDVGTSVNASGTVIFTSGIATPGTYKVCFHPTDGYSVATSVEFKVVPVISGLVGDWKFDDPNNLVKATVGSDLQQNGTAISAVEGPTMTDGAVRKGPGSNFMGVNPITPNGNNNVNSYSFVFDYKISTISVWHSLLQTVPENNTDASVFIGKLGNIGVSATGYTSQTTRINTWNRAVVVVNNGSEYSIYFNGEKGLTGYVQAIDGKYGLKPTFLIAADNDGEDAEIDIAHVMLYNKALNQDEAQSLGGYTQDVRPLCSFLSEPYVQNVTPDSITVMWESDFLKDGSNKVNYGTNSDLTGGGTIIANATLTSANTYIQKAVIKPLNANTKYYFRAISNSTPKNIQNVKTSTTDVNSVFTVGIWGNSYNLNPFSKMATYMVKTLAPDFCVTTGDLTLNGNDTTELRNVFIPTTLGIIGAGVPFYGCLGNRDDKTGNSFIRNYIKQPTMYNSDPSAVNGSYAYVHGNSVFICIDPTRYNTDLAPNGWLETFLKSDVSKSAKFRFIIINNAPFHERCQKAEQSVVKTNIPLLSKKYGVTAVFGSRMNGYERSVVDGVQYFTQGGCSTLDTDSIVGPNLYNTMIVGTNKSSNPANFNNGLNNHILTLDVTPVTATANLHYFDASGNYIGIIESVDMTGRGLDDVKSPTDLGFTISPNPTQGILKIAAPENVDVTVFNLQGKAVFTKLNMLPDSEIDLSGLSQGVYLVKLKAGQNDFSKTVVIK
jgi:hypothetical protein